MKNHTPPPHTTEALLDGLIAECHAIIRDLVRPALAAAEPMQRPGCIHAVAALADSAVKLGDAVGRLRGTAPQPEIRQRITVEKVQTAPRTLLQSLSDKQGEGG